MFLSVFDVFKIGIGPSSSHTMGPMTAAGRFLDQMRAHPAKAEFAAVRVGLYGSLAFTGKGHATDRAIAIDKSRRGRLLINRVGQTSAFRDEAKFIAS